MDALTMRKSKQRCKNELTVEEIKMIDQDPINQKIIAMWNENYTSGEISSILKISRSSVMGRVTRMREKGIELRSIKKKTVLKRAIKRQVKTTMGWVTRKYIKPDKTPDIALDQLFLDVEIPQQRIDIMQLTPRSCRYIIETKSARGAIYCGSTTQYKSYCKKHADMCYKQVNGVQGV
jgi:hypothetical protein